MQSKTVVQKSIPLNEVMMCIGQCDISCMVNGIVCNDIVLCIPYLKCITTKRNIKFFGANGIVCDNGVFNHIHVNAIERICNGIMADLTHFYMVQFYGSIQIFHTFSGICNMKVPKNDMVTVDGNDRTFPLSFYGDILCFSDNGQRFIDDYVTIISA